MLAHPMARTDRNGEVSKARFPVSIRRFEELPLFHRGFFPTYSATPRSRTGRS
jgi:hypothetical protein